MTIVGFRRLAVWAVLVMLLTALRSFASESLRKLDSASAASWTVSRMEKLSDIVIIELQNTEKSRKFHLHLDDKMFADSAKLTTDGNMSSTAIRTTNTYKSVQTPGADWGTVTLQNQDDDIKRFWGMFSIEGALYVVKNQQGANHILTRRLDETTILDTVAHIPTQESAEDDIWSSAEVHPVDSPVAEPFYPGCYPGDGRSLDVHISIATDAGFYEKVNQANPSAPESQKIANVQLEVERTLSGARAIYLAQLNVQLRVQEVVVGSAKSTAAVLRRTRSNGCPSSVDISLNDFSSWVRASAAPSAHWHLFTDCHPMPGYVGRGYEKGLCDNSGFNTAVSSYQFDDSLWSIVAHEMGHVFGAQHTFYNNKGGIMDNGSGRLFGGDYGFHYSNRPQICGHLTSTLASKCPFIGFSETDASNCGNGVLETDENCECLTLDSQSCGVCQKCRLTKPRECSLPSEGFVVRHPSTPKFISVLDPTLVSDAECCVNGVLSDKTCNQDKDICSPVGKCEKACRRFIMGSSFLEPCGFDDTGCIQKCMHNFICYGAELTTQGPPVYPVGAVPDGRKCMLGVLAGTCSSGVCIISDNATRAPSQRVVTQKPTTPQPTQKPTMAMRSPTFKVTSSPTNPTPRPTVPTSKPTKKAPTKKVKKTKAPVTKKPTTHFPTKAPTPSPTAKTQKPTSSPTNSPIVPTSPPSTAPTSSPSLACPVPELFFRCANQKKRKVCKRKGCHWCGKGKGLCQPTSLICQQGKISTPIIYSHCLPFTLAPPPSTDTFNAEDAPWTCPSPDEMIVCGISNARKACPKNPFLKCQWCGKQRKCVPARIQEAGRCNYLASCPNVPPEGDDSDEEEGDDDDDDDDDDDEGQ